ncbi:MAG: hypothetical protein ABIZ91_19315 [Gemmatimonadaceae bacterium]
MRRAIEAHIAKRVEATRTQDIDAYMASVPADLVVHDESGARIDRETLRANALRDWSLIPRTLAIDVTVDSLHTFSDTAATVYTSQRWERLMRQRTGEVLDTVLTTQSHREQWRRTSKGWYSYEVTELGGQVWVNGKPYAP